MPKEGKMAIDGSGFPLPLGLEFRLVVSAIFGGDVGNEPLTP
jgi:hypothetical protein